MKEIAVITLCTGIWLFVFAISFSAWKPVQESRSRMAVSGEGELIELDEHETALAE